MNATQERQVTIAGNALHATISPARGLDGDRTIRITPRHGESLTTADYDAALDHLCGGSDKNRTIDSISGQPAQIVAAEDTSTKKILCRQCHLNRSDRMTPRFNPLTPQQLDRLTKQTGLEHCDNCGRKL